MYKPQLGLERHNIYYPLHLHRIFQDVGYRLMDQALSVEKAACLVIAFHLEGNALLLHALSADKRSAFAHGSFSRIGGSYPTALLRSTARSLKNLSVTRSWKQRR
jgi:hypothetical protein